MRPLSIFVVDDKKTRQLLKKYRAGGRAETEMDLCCYRLVRFDGYSVKEMSEKVNLSHSAAYRRFKKVDLYIRSQVKRFESE